MPGNPGTIFSCSNLIPFQFIKYIFNKSFIHGNTRAPIKCTVRSCNHTFKSLSCRIQTPHNEYTTHTFRFKKHCFDNDLLAYNVLRICHTYTAPLCLVDYINGSVRPLLAWSFS